MQSDYAKLLRAVLTAPLMLAAVSGAAVAGPLEDALAAHDKGDDATALRLIRPLADQGNAEAQYNLGLMFGNGQGVSQDYAAAIKWFRLAAVQGDADAQYSLGRRYYNGEGVAKDYAEAAKWFRLGAEQGHAGAQYAL